MPAPTRFTPALLTIGTLLLAPTPALGQASLAVLAPTPPAAVLAAPIAGPTVGPTVGPTAGALPEDLTTDDRRRLSEGESALADGRAEEALEKAQLGLEYLPKSVLMNDLAARAAAALGQADLALHYAQVALGQPEATEDKSLKSVVSGLHALQAEHDPNLASIQAELDGYAETLFNLGKSASRRKLWANAVDFLQRCEGTAFATKAEKELAKIYKKDDAVEALVASGLPIEFESTANKKSPEAIAKLDKKHQHWEDALEVDTKMGYTIRSNGGYLFTQEIGRAMDQVNLFLRDMYQHKVQGQRMRGSEIDVHASKEEFMNVHGQGPNIGGFFEPWSNRVVSYWEPDINAVLNTLFHEASHQFMRDVTKNTVPAWINEGIACYFEGTELLPNGKILANLVPESRLRSLVNILKGDMADVKDAITYFQGGSYDGIFYPVGWGLVYFMRNYENENAERVYRPHFDAYVETYKSGGTHNVFDRFVEYFIERPKQDDVTNYNEFLQKWEQWIYDLADVYYGDETVADGLLDKAERQVEAGHIDNALETYRWALDKREGDVRAIYGLATCNQELKNDDVALYYFRQLLDWSLSQSDAEARVPKLGMTAGDLAELSMEGIKEVNDDVANGMLAANDNLAASLVGVAKDYREKGFPRQGMALLDRTTEMLGPRAAVLDLHAEILANSGIDLREKRRLRVDRKLSFWASTSEEDFKADGDDIAGSGGASVSYLTYSELPPADYHFEATIEVETLASGADTNPAFGIYFGSGLGVRQMVGYTPTSGGLSQIETTVTGPKHIKTLNRLKVGEGESFVLAVVVEDNEVTVLLDGEVVDVLEVDEEDVPGQVGIFVQQAEIKFSGMRFVYDSRDA